MELVLTRLRPQHLRGLGLLVAAGIAADITWEFWARVVTAIVIGGPLQPSSLILSLFRLPEAYRLLAEALHVTTGVLFYPLLFLFVRRVIFSGGTLVDGIVIGVATWIL